MATARAWEVPLPQALLALGVMTDAAYTSLVARSLGVPALTEFEVVGGPPLMWLAGYPVRQVRDASGQKPMAVVVATAGPLDDLRRTSAGLATAGYTLGVAAPADMAVAIERADRTRAMRQATLSLVRHRPDLSAARGMAHWQMLTLASVVGAVAGGAVVETGLTIAVLMAIMLTPFVGVVIVRVVALAALFRPASEPEAATRSGSVPDAELPTYSVLVPLFHEAEVIPDLVASLSALDYPAAKLDIILVLEEADVPTKVALLTANLPRTMRLLVVPDSHPRTKPKALNYAMHFARGDFVVVFDAEDRPDADQLRKAAAAFRDGPPNLACVQARLNIYNPRDSWYTRQFTIEYSALFDAILPALDWLKLPVPLGGTSNHFPRALLQSIGGWDPFNVTEDADLGIRLSRLGYTTQVFDSTTWEEAPLSWKQWKPQRTRWLKGWYQTYLVHMRKPRQLLADLGWWQTLGFHLFLGGVILSTLVHPLVYILGAWRLFGGSIEMPAAFDGPALWYLSWGTLLVGYASAMLVGALAGQRRGHGLLRSTLWMPFCWLLVSWAAYRALWQLWRDPFLWEKTAHGRAKSAKPRDSGAKPP